MFSKSFFIPDKEYLISCISILFDLIEIYKEETLKLLEDETTKRIDSISQKIRDSEIINLNDKFQYFKNGAKYNTQLNPEELF